MISKLFQTVIQYVLLSAVCVCSGKLSAQESKTLYFYSPEVNTARNTVLKGTFDQYLESVGNHQFQPVKEQSVFEELLLSNQADALIMSSLHFTQMLDSHTKLASQYVVVLQGEKNGSDTFLKLLVSANKGSDLSGGILASARNEAVTLSLLDRMFPGQTTPRVKSLSILEVPKDIDALMAVGFGLADMALTSDDSLSVLSSLYRDQYEQIDIVGKSIPQKRMVLILSKSSLDDEWLLGDMLYSMPQTSLGRRALKLLSLDAWRWLIDEKSIQGGTL